MNTSFTAASFSDMVNTLIVVRRHKIQNLNCDSLLKNPLKDSCGLSYKQERLIKEKRDKAYREERSVVFGRRSG